MTLSEFKAWFEGFTETMDGPPSLKQWERIQARVKEITGSPVTERVFVDRYWPHITKTWWDNGVRYQPYSTCLAATPVASTVGQLTAGSIAFESHSAMNALGKADAQTLAS